MMGYVDPLPETEIETELHVEAETVKETEYNFPKRNRNTIKMPPVTTDIFCFQQG